VSNITFAYTYPQYMDVPEVPSGGDWSVLRDGAVLLHGVERITVEACQFLYLGGNGIVVSNYSMNTTLNLNTFHTLAMSAVIVLGNPRYFAPDPWDMRNERNYPSNTIVSNSWASYFGLFVSQSAAVFVSLAYNTTIVNNVFHNGPRAGINFNDGFLGGHTVANNVLFNLVETTRDHGPINSWDRQRWVLPRPMQPNTIQYNFLVGTANGPLGIDLDDGASHFTAVNNLVVYGCLKLKGMYNTYSSNLVLYPLAFGTNWITRGCIVLNDGDSLAPQLAVTGTTCVSNYEGVSYGPTWTLPCNKNTFWLSNNTYWANGFYSCDMVPASKLALAFYSWQKTSGQESASTFHEGVPPVNDVLQLAMAFPLSSSS